MARAFESLGRSFLDRVPSIVTGLIVFALFFVASRVGSRVVRDLGGRTHLARNFTELLARIGSFLVVLSGLLAAALIIFPSFRVGDLIAGLGLTSVAVGFAFKDIFQNFFAGLFLLWRQPFRVGDEVTAGGFSGTVEEITARSTRIRTYDGERAVIPNADVYTQSVLVRTAFGRRRSRITFGVGYDQDLERARETLHATLEATDGVLKDPGPWVVVSEVAPSTVNLTAYYWTDDAQREVLRVADLVATRALKALAEAGVELPFPTQVVVLQNPGLAS